MTVSGQAADPVGVIVSVITAAEHELDRSVIEGIVAGLAGGRAKQRRLAQALSGRPAVLTDGRSPAPRALGNLLIALRSAGAAGISAPACARCGKPLDATMQRRGQDWFCHSCGPAREPCAACGNTRTVVFRGRDGGSRCGQCPPRDSDDPATVIAEIVTAIDPGIPADVIAVAVAAAAPGSGQRMRLAWALQDQPGLLTGDGARAPVPAVLRLIGLLRDAGATGIMPALRAGDPASQAPRRRAAMPELRGQVQGRAVRPLRDRP